MPSLVIPPPLIIPLMMAVTDFDRATNHLHTLPETVAFDTTIVMTNYITGLLEPVSLNDSIINLYASLLVQTQGWFSVDSTYHQGKARQSQTAAVKVIFLFKFVFLFLIHIFIQAKCNESEIIVFPLHLPPNHYVLGLFKKSTSEFLCYDSLSYAKAAIPRNIQKSVQDYLCLIGIRVQKFVNCSVMAQGVCIFIYSFC